MSEPSDRAKACMRELWAVLKKYDAQIGGCGCCGSPWLIIGAEAGSEKIDEFDMHLPHEAPREYAMWSVEDPE